MLSPSRRNVSSEAARQAPSHVREAVCHFEVCLGLRSAIAFTASERDLQDCHSGLKGMEGPANSGASLAALLNGVARELQAVIPSKEREDNRMAHMASSQRVTVVLNAVHGKIGDDVDGELISSSSIYLAVECCVLTALVL